MTTAKAKVVHLVLKGKHQNQQSLYVQKQHIGKECRRRQQPKESRLKQCAKHYTNNKWKLSDCKQKQLLKENITKHTGQY